MSERRARTYLFILVCALAALLFTAPGRGYWVIDPDAAAYVGLARSLVNGDGYTLQGIPHAKFPPGFPALLSLPIAWTGDPECYAAMRDCVTAMGLLSVILAYAVGRRLLGATPGRSLALATTSAISIYLLQYSVAYIRSETTFAACFLGALLLGERWRQRGGFGGALLAGLVAGAALSVRSAGLAGIAAIVLARSIQPNPWRLAIDRRSLGECLVFGIVALSPMVAHQAWVKSACRAANVEPTDYGDELFAAYALDLTKDVDTTMPTIEPLSSEMLARIHGNLAALGLSLGKFVVNDNKGANLATRPLDLSLHPGGYGLLALLLVGLAICVRRGQVIVATTLVCYLGLYLIWPFNQQQRFYQPIAPLLLAALAFGASTLLRRVLRVANTDLGRVAGLLALCGLTAAIAATRSTDPVLLDRYSKSLAAILIALAATTGVVGFLTIRWRGLRLDLGQYEASIHATAIAGVLLLGTGTFLVALRNLGLEHREFLASRAAQPVASPFTRIKTDPELIALLEKLLAVAKPDDLVMSDIPKMIHEMTGLPTTPLRYSSRDAHLELETPRGRPRFLYYSREIPQVDAVFDAVLATRPKWLVPIHEVRLEQGALTIPLALYQVLDD